MGTWFPGSQRKRRPGNDSSSSSDDGDGADDVDRDSNGEISDTNGNGNNSLAAKVNRASEQNLVNNPNMARREENIREREEAFERYMNDNPDNFGDMRVENSEDDFEQVATTNNRRNFVEVQPPKKKKNKKNKN